jgi:hypothetical protein
MKLPWSEFEQNIGIAKECDCVGVALCKIDEDGTPIAYHISPDTNTLPRFLNLRHLPSMRLQNSSTAPS